ncbi:MAG: methyltransferase domain-containing protein [Gemmatimonadetes bacterium]|nr:methyltransferase domain-containing protein [Gemmatimonadota bacterium]
MTTTEETIATKGLVMRAAQARWYDALAAVLTLGRDRALRDRLAGLAQLAPGESVLDVGCGTGSLALAAKRRVGDTGTVDGVDASPDMIALATRKATRAGAAVTFRVGTAERLPYPDASFDAVMATLMLHHLPAPLRRDFAREALRVLRPGGRILAVDFSAASAQSAGLLARLHRRGGVSRDAMVVLLRDAGFHPEATGAVGIADLQYVVAESPAAGDPVPSPDEPPALQSLPPMARPEWIVFAVLAVAVAVHLAIVGQLAARVAWSAAGLLAAVALLAFVVVHIFGGGRARH